MILCILGQMCVCVCVNVYVHINTQTDTHPWYKLCFSIICFSIYSILQTNIQDSGRIIITNFTNALSDNIGSF